MNDYTSSIIIKYGDTDNVRRDIETLNEIQGRQGSGLLIDMIAESAGAISNKFKLNEIDRQNISNNLIDELRTALKERM